MKRFILALLLVSGVCIMAAASLSMLSQVKDDLYRMADDITARMEQGDYDGAYETARELRDYWEERHIKLALFFRRYKLDEVTESVTRLPSYIRYRELGEVNAETQRVRELADSLWATELPRLSSVF